MNYAQIFQCDIANGPGCRTSLFVSGCTHHCPGCFNEIAWDFNYGKPFTKAVEDQLILESRPSYIDGFTLRFRESSNQRVIDLKETRKSGRIILSPHGEN